MSISTTGEESRLKVSSSFLVLSPPPHPAHMQHPVPRTVTDRSDYTTRDITIQGKKSQT